MFCIISSISSWAQGIVVSVIIATIIEMLVPNNGNGKYIKTVVGIFVLFTIISPVLGKFKSKDDVFSNLDSNIHTSEYETVLASNNPINTDNTIMKMFEENLKVDIKSKVSQRGYTTDNIYLEILNNKEYTLNKIELKVTGRIESNNQSGNYNNVTTIVDNIENIKVNLGGSRKDDKKEEKSILNESEKRKLKEYLSSVYDVKENNIIVN
ncbi:MAG: stage III sporulation protein AF [Clostridia bacterium]|nr:stage III sporulation protein AF [Clostridia bacterium]